MLQVERCRSPPAGRLPARRSNSRAGTRGRCAARPAAERRCGLRHPEGCSEAPLAKTLSPTHLARQECLAYDPAARQHPALDSVRSAAGSRRVPRRPESRGSCHEPAELLGQFRPRRRTRVQAIHFVAHRSPPGRPPGKRGSASRWPTLRAAPARTNPTATAGAKQSIPAKKSRFCCVGEHAEPRDHSVSMSIGRARTRGSSASPGRPARRGTACPAAHDPFRGAQQIDRALLDAVVRQMPDHDLVRHSCPTRRAARSRLPPVHSPRIDAQPLQMHALCPARRVDNARRVRRASARTRHRPAAAATCRCGAVYCRRVRSCGSSGSPRCRNGVRKNGTPRRRASRRPHSDRERIRERGGVDGVERAVVAAGVAPHRRADRVARRGEALPGSGWGRARAPSGCSAGRGSGGGGTGSDCRVRSLDRLTWARPLISHRGFVLSPEALPVPAPWSSTRDTSSPCRTRYSHSRGRIGLRAAQGRRVAVNELATCMSRPWRSSHYRTRPECAYDESRRWSACNALHQEPHAT